LKGNEYLNFDPIYIVLPIVCKGKGLSRAAFLGKMDLHFKRRKADSMNPIPLFLCTGKDSAAPTHIHRFATG
jgi:hypothetical protein